jgi:hypothetical protein
MRGYARRFYKVLLNTREHEEMSEMSDMWDTLLWDIMHTMLSFTAKETEKNQEM